MVRFEDWLRDDRPGGDARIAKLEKNFNDLLSVLKNKSKLVPYLVCCFPIATHLKFEIEVFDLLQELNNRWLSSLEGMENVYRVDFRNLAGQYNINPVFDKISDQTGHLPFSDGYYAAMGTMIARQVLVWQQQPFKVIALDCDNTLWKGICGEAGPVGIVVEPPYQAFQQFLIQQQREGMLLALCGKNNEADVWRVFESDPDMILAKESLASWKINRQPQSENLKALAGELHLSLESFIFIDDSPVETAEVMAHCPEVLTLCLPEDSRQLASFLSHIWAFDRQWHRSLFLPGNQFPSHRKLTWTGIGKSRRLIRPISSIKNTYCRYKTIRLIRC